MAPPSYVDEFMQDKAYLLGVSKHTLSWYSCAFQAYRSADLNNLDEGLPQRIKRCTMDMLNRGVKPVSVNTYLCAIRAYLNWCHREGYLPKPIRIPRLKADQPAVETYSLEQVRKMVTAKPIYPGEQRLQCILAVLFDTGARIGEVLELTRDCVDLDRMLINFRKTKTRKPRVVPFGPLTRKLLYRWLKTHDHDLVFCAQNGETLDVNNLRRDFYLFRMRLRIPHPRKQGFHVCRHTFAVEFLRAGGDVFTLQRILGHSTLEMTRRYVHLNVGDLQQGHRKYATLVR